MGGACRSPSRAYSRPATLEKPIYATKGFPMICAGAAEPVRHLEELGRELAVLATPAARSSASAVASSISIAGARTLQSALLPRFTESQLPGRRRGRGSG